MLTREEKLAIAFDYAKSRQLIELKGTTAQIESAMIIRYVCLTDSIFELKADQYARFEGQERMSIEEANLYIDYALKQDHASFWLNYKSISGSIDSYFFYKYVEQEILCAPLDTSIHSQNLLHPAQEVSSVIIDMRIHAEDRLVIESVGSNPDILIPLMRQHQFTNDGKAFIKNLLLPQQGSATDRLAEIGQILHEAGLILNVQDAQVRELICGGYIAPISHRWVDFIEHKEEAYFEVTWEYNNELYGKLKTIPGSLYVSKKEGMPITPAHIKVPLLQYREMAHILDQSHFKWTDRAQKVANQLQEWYEHIPVIGGEERPLPSKNTPFLRPPVLELPEFVDIDNELLENDW